MTKENSGLSRRQFLGTGALAAGTAALGGAALPARAATGAPILLKGGCVLTLDRKIGDFAKADVLIEGKTIKEVRPNIDAPAATVIDAADTVVLPGFVDSHHHLWETVMRNATPDDSLVDYYKHVNNVLGSAFKPEDVHAGNLVGALGTLDAGTTTVWDWSHIQNSPAHSDAAVEGLRQSGSRVVFGYGFPILADPKAKWWEDKSHKYPDDMLRLAKQYFSSTDQLVTLGHSSVSPGATPDPIFVRVLSVAREVKAHTSVHVGTLGKSGILEPLGRAGVLKDDMTYVHCNALNDAEWKMIADTGGTVSCATPIEMFMGHGVPAVQRALDFGIRPSLSVDVETQATGDMFAQMRGTLAIQRMLASARAAKGDKDAPKWLTARDVLEFATIEGARACALDHKVGTLTPGKEADIILLRADRLNTMPLNNAVGAVVLSMDASNVDTVLVAGRLVKRHGRMIGVDMKRLSRMIGAARDRVMTAAKFPNPRV